MSGEAKSDASPTEEVKPKATAKVEVRLQATGDAPIMKQKNYKVDADKRVDWIITFIRKYLKLEDSDNLVIFIFTTKDSGRPV